MSLDNLSRRFLPNQFLLFNQIIITIFTDNLTITW